MLDAIWGVHYAWTVNRLPIQKRTAILGMLAEGSSLRSTSRMADVSINTVTKLLVEVGAACSDFQDRMFRNLKLNRIQCDEIWSFVYAKEKNVTPKMLERGHAGDVWTWTAMDADTKLVLSWRLGSRDAHTAKEFIDDLAGRLANRVQLTTDGHKAYLTAVEGAFGSGVDYAMLVKLYGADSEQEKRYSPAQCIGAVPTVVMGNPHPKHISTSYIERQNLTMRMYMRRFTRLTNGFSKKLQNHAAALALYFMYYNFARIHKTLRVTPAMEAGAADHVWDLEEIALLGKLNVEVQIMPTENETRPCTHPGCNGTQMFRLNAPIPGSVGGPASTETGTGFPGNRQPPWMCDKERDHYELTGSR